MNSQLIKENNVTSGYTKVYPIAYTSGISNKATGIALDDTLESINSIYVPFKGTPALTRAEVSAQYRRKGIKITYTDASGSSITEVYIGSESDTKVDAFFVKGENWILDEYYDGSSSGTQAIIGANVESVYRADVPQASVELKGSELSFTFGLPKGDKGDKGDKGEKGANGADGAPGEAGARSITVMAYKASEAQPATPNSGSYNFDTNTPTYPSGWKTSGLDLEGTIWMSFNTYISDGTNLGWSEPIRVSGKEGVSPNTAYKATAFKRSNKDISKEQPTGGNYNNPIPTGWSDGIPSGQEMLWATTRIFSSDGLSPQEPAWSLPKQMTDTASFDVEFCDEESPTHVTPQGHPNNTSIAPEWKNTATRNTIWMATSTMTNGEWSDWSVSKIKGERGNDGTSIKIKGTLSSTTELPTKPTDPSDCYVINGDLYVWDGDSWENVGPFKGDKGDSSYLHVKYAKSLTENDWSASNGETPDKYIGTYVDNNPTDQLVWNLYKWKKWVGDDGFSYEYIYKLTTTETAPTTPTENSQEDDFVPTGWTDDPSGVSSTNPYEWVVYRQKSSGTWSSFKGSSADTKKAALWAKYGKDGNTPIAPNTSFKAIAFKRTNDAITQPVGGSYSSPVPTNGWSDGIPEGTEKLWGTTRIFSSDGKAPQQSAWTTPKVMADSADFDVEYCELEDYGSSVPVGHPNTNSNWSNNATKNTVWMATSYYANGTWSDWKIAKIKGEKGSDGTSIKIKGSKKLESELPTTPDDPSDAYIIGQDLWVWDGDNWINAGQFKGDAGEPGKAGDSAYIHIKYAKSLDPFAWTESNGEVPGNYIGIYVDNKSTDSIKQSDYKWTKWQGEDGFGYEYIYKVTSTSTAPNTPTETSQNDDFVPSGGWTDNPTGVSQTNPYEWVCFRKKVQGIWQEFEGSATNKTKAALWAKFGKDGNDGKTYDAPNWKTYIYKESETKPTPSGTSLLPNGWSDYPSSSGKWWQCVGTVDGATNKVTAWGEAQPMFGEKGINGTYVEFRFKIQTDDKVKAEINDTTRNPSGWEVSPTYTVGKGYAMWMSHATINYDETLLTNWATPVRISGERGPEGGTGPVGVSGSSMNVIYSEGNITSPNNSDPDEYDTIAEVLQNWTKSISTAMKWLSDDYPYLWACNYTTTYNRKSSDPTSSDYNVFVETNTFQKPYRMQGEKGDKGEDGISGQKPDSYGYVYTFGSKDSYLWRGDEPKDYDGDSEIPSGWYRTIKEAKAALAQYCEEEGDDPNTLYIWACMHSIQYFYNSVTKEWVEDIYIFDTPYICENKDGEDSIIYEIVTGTDDLEIGQEDVSLKIRITQGSSVKLIDFDDDSDAIYNLSMKATMNNSDFSYYIEQNSDSQVYWGGSYTIKSGDKLRLILYKGKIQVAEKTIRCTQSGKRGQMVYPAGNYNLETAYTTDDNSAPYVYDSVDKNYYVLNAIMTWIGEEQDKKRPSSGVKDSSGNLIWVKFDKFNAVYTQVGVIENGTVGAAVFNKDWMISKYGEDEGVYGTNYQNFITDANGNIDANNNSFTPAFALNFKQGTASFGYGNLKIGSNGQVTATGMRADDALINNAQVYTATVNNATINTANMKDINAENITLKGDVRAEELIVTQGGIDTFKFTVYDSATMGTNTSLSIEDGTPVLIVYHNNKTYVTNLMELKQSSGTSYQYTEVSPEVDTSKKFSTSLPPNSSSGEVGTQLYKLTKAPYLKKLLNSEEVGQVAANLYDSNGNITSWNNIIGKYYTSNPVKKMSNQDINNGVLNYQISGTIANYSTTGYTYSNTLFNTIALYISGYFRQVGTKYYNIASLENGVLKESTNYILLGNKYKKQTSSGVTDLVIDSGYTYFKAVGSNITATDATGASYKSDYFMEQSGTAEPVNITQINASSRIGISKVPGTGLDSGITV